MGPAPDVMPSVQASGCSAWSRAGTGMLRSRFGPIRDGNDHDRRLYMRAATALGPQRPGGGAGNPGFCVRPFPDQW